MIWDVDKARDALPNECEITLDHAMMHIRSAILAQCHADYPQMIHDIEMAALTLLSIIAISEGKEGEE